MRIRILLLTSSLLVLASGCRQRPVAVPYNGPIATSYPVGPVPGAVHMAVKYPTSPFDDDPVGLQDGRRLFNWYNCSGCHGGHAGGGMGPSLRDPVWLYGNRDDQIFDTIAQGRSKGMPAWGSKIPQNQIWELVAYIQSMGKPWEPDPPVEPTDEEVPNPDQNTKLGVGTQTHVSGRD